MSDPSDETAEKFDQSYWSDASHYRRYEDYAAGHDELRGWFSGLVRMITPLLPPAPARVVDAGCGHGVIVEALLERGYDAMGFDPSEWIIHEAQQFSPALGAALKVGVIEDLPFDGEFDAITCFEVFEHIHDPVTALRALRDHLRPGGKLIFSTPNLEPRSKWKDPRTSDPTHVNVHGRGWWEGATRAAGLEVVRATTFAPIPLTWRVDHRLGYWQKLGKRLGPQVLIVATR
jgi:SAM-dependent methyltransferase